ncbi:MAG: EAL domain-containing protein [Candidatus Limnocylindria bacterium]
MSSAGPPRARSASGLTLRMLAAIAVALVCAAMASAASKVLVPGTDSLPPVTGLAAFAAVTAVLVWLILRPLLRSQAELEVRYAAALADALSDPLTGLGNHRAFHEELDRQVEAAKRYEQPLALVVIDLDEFKAVNDRDGHAAGDRVLRGFGQLLASGARRADRSYRVGGDEFAILLPHTNAEGARMLTRRLLAIALQPPVREAEPAAISFSAGISAIPELADDRPRLYSQADAALYAAKHGGRTDVVVFEPTAEAAPIQDGASTAIADVIARGQLRPVYQPIVELASGAVLGVEGLIRPASTTPFTDPAGLFAAADASGRLTALDLACVETIVAGASRLPGNQFLSVNLSPRTFEAPEFSAQSLMAILIRHRFAPERLIVELTEQQPITDADRARRKIEACRSAGIRFAADDIGAGNAGLRLLAQIRFDVLKVDLSLVQRSAPGAPSSAVLSSVVDLAARTGALVVAEGVEHQSEVSQLAALGVRAAQGFYLGRPGPLLAPDAPDAAVGASMSAWRQTIGLPTAAGS